MTNSSFDDIAETAQFKKYLEMIPVEQREKIVESLKQLCQQFEQNVINPIQRHQAEVQKK